MGIYQKILVGEPGMGGSARGSPVQTCLGDLRIPRLGGCVFQDRFIVSKRFLVYVFRGPAHFFGGGALTATSLNICLKIQPLGWQDNLPEDLSQGGRGIQSEIRPG